MGASLYEISSFFAKWVDGLMWMSVINQLPFSMFTFCQCGENVRLRMKIVEAGGITRALRIGRSESQVERSGEECPQAAEKRRCA